MRTKSEISDKLAVIALTCGILLGLPTAAQTADYKIDPAHSFIQFRVSHLGVGWVFGRFNTLAGEFTYDPAAGPAAQKVSVTIDTASIDTNHAERDKDLRSPNSLDVETYPKMTFVSTGFSGDADGGTLTGDLSLHGVTKSISFPVKRIAEGDDPWGNYRAGFEGKYTLVRADFGFARNFGPKGASVDIELSIEGIRQ
jgi:polyisoprenoid-binding protein YceI